MKILYQNQVPNAILNLFSENSNFKFSTAFSDTVLSRVGQTIGDTGEYIEMAFPAAISVTHFIILNHNFEAAATVKIQANTSASWVSPPFSRTQTISDVIYDTFASVSYRYWRLYMDHPTSADGFFKLSKIYLGLAYTPANPDAGIDQPDITKLMIDKSIGGQLFGQAGTYLQSHNLKLSGLSQSDVDNYRTFRRSVNNNTPFIFIPYEDSVSTIPPYYANAVNHGALRLTEEHGISYSISGIQFEECK